MRPNPHIVNQCCAGDIHLFFLDRNKALRLLGFEPWVHIVDGLHDLLKCVKVQAVEDDFAQVQEELAARALVK